MDGHKDNSRFSQFCEGAQRQKDVRLTDFTTTVRSGSTPSDTAAPSCLCVTQRHPASPSVTQTEGLFFKIRYGKLFFGKVWLTPLVFNSTDSKEINFT
jgi:hypothetical protein